MTSNGRHLDVVMVVGACRERAQHALNRLCAQTAIAATHIVVVDVAPGSSTPLQATGSADVEIVRLPQARSWADARRAGVERAASPVIAFIEEHCFTDPDWAGAIIDAHKGPWASVGYSFRNANPDSYVSRSAMVTDYGLWLEPIGRGETQLLPGNNVSYKRDHLLGLGDLLAGALACDFVAHEAFRKRGLPMFVEPNARVAHLNFTTVRETGYTNYVWCRAMAAQRARAAHWSLARRLAQAAVTPVSAPVYRIARIVRRLGSEPRLWRRFFLSLPVLLIVGFWAGAGEAAGYLLGPGSAEAELMRWELDIERTPRD